MFVLMCVLLVVAAVLLILAVLIQPGKGAGLASSGFVGVAGQFSNMFGVRRTSDFLQKFTIGLAIGILAVAVITNKFFLDTSASRSATGTSTEQRVPITVGAEKPAAPAQPQQAAPQGQQQGQQAAPQGQGQQQQGQPQGQQQQK